MRQQSRAYHQYNNLHNEGGEGFNPHDSEMDELRKMGAARIAKYGSEYCPKCHQVYKCNRDTMAVEDHVCAPKPVYNWD